MGKIGFDLKGEFIPCFDKFQDDFNKRLMFLGFFNQEMGCEIEFTKEEMLESKNMTLCNLFINKILNNLTRDCYVSSTNIKIDIKKTIKINKFLKNMKDKVCISKYNFKLLNSLYEPKIDVAIQLIQILEKYNFSIFFDGETIFKNFVSNKIQNSRFDREVIVHNDSIDIKSKNEKNEFKTKIYTFWQFLDAKNLNIDSHIKKAVNCIENTEFKQVYLVFPKNENFDKHIKIECEEINCNEYEIKLIPYSLRSTLR